MKIVDYETFIRMPSGTIFAPYTPCVFQERFQIKVDEGSSYTNPFGKTSWMFNGTMPLEPWFKSEDDMAFDLGVYDTEMCVYDGDSTDAAAYKMFAILEDHEIDRLIFALQWAKGGCSENWEESEDD